jgi:hypothetical protein
VDEIVAGELPAPKTAAEVTETAAPPEPGRLNLVEPAAKEQNRTPKSEV